MPANYRDLLETPAETEGFSKFLGLDGLLVELLYYTVLGEPGGHVGPTSRRPMNQLGYTHLGLRVESPEQYEALPERIREFGGYVIEASHIRVGEFEGEPIESFFATDPDGTRLEFMRLPARFPVGGTVYRPRDIVLADT